MRLYNSSTPCGVVVGFAGYCLDKETPALLCNVDFCPYQYKNGRNQRGIHYQYSIVVLLAQTLIGCWSLGIVSVIGFSVRSTLAFTESTTKRPMTVNPIHV